MQLKFEELEGWGRGGKEQPEKAQKECRLERERSSPDICHWQAGLFHCSDEERLEYCQTKEGGGGRHRLR